METSLDVKASELYDFIRPESLLSWVRVRSANLIAIDGQDWVSKFSYDHSGTYANQWMIIDFTKFDDEKKSDSDSDRGRGSDRGDSGEDALKPGFLTVIEEMPGMIRSGDETHKLLVSTSSLSLSSPHLI
jgi:hypothetical protein